MLVTAATTVLYLFAYTPLKLRTPLCTIVGAVPGALPPVTGWVASHESFGLGAWVLFGILFLWQLPHTLAIARLYRDDYARAGVRLLPVVDVHGTSTERQIVTGCLALLAVSLLPTLIGLAGPFYFVGAFVLGAAFVGARDSPGPIALGQLGPARPVRVLTLSADPARPAGVRQGMTSDARNRQTVRILLTIVGALVVAAFLIGIRW